MDYNKLNNMLSELTLETDSNDTEISSVKSVSCFFSRELELKELLQNDLEEFNTQNPRNSKKLKRVQYLIKRLILTLQIISILN